MARIHTDGPVCPGCEKKLDGGHPLLRQWFRIAKKEHPDVHVSYVFRNKEDQDTAVMIGASRALWPTSKHNYTVNGYEYSLAMDLFKQVAGVYYAGRSFFEHIDRLFKSKNSPLQWGGDWKGVDGKPDRLGDLCHWQVPDALIRFRPIEQPEIDDLDS